MIARRKIQQRTTTYSPTAYLALCGLFAAITALCSWITIPIGFTPVPFNLGLLGVFLASGILGRKYGTISLLVYVCMGGVGIPVFAGFQAGFGVLLGPTGGYIIGYIAAGFIIGGILDSPFYAKRLLRCIAALLLGLAACYSLGTLWFVFSTGTTLWAALLSCVFPFLPGDAVKIAVAALLIQRLRPLL